MHVRRGRAATIEADRNVTDTVVARATRKREPVLRVWCPHRQVAFGRRDERADGYEAACEAAETHGFPATFREVGGRAVAFSGTTVAVVYALPVENYWSGVEERYDDAVELLTRALADVGVTATPEEPPDTFCPGSHSLSADGKVAGVAQRVRQNVAVVGAVVVVTDHELIAEVLEAVYEPLELPFDPESVGSVAAAGGRAEPKVVGDAIERAFREW